MAYILNYTREPVNEVIYDPRLAYSMHLAVSEDGKEYRALNHNSGILFVKATENEDGSLNPKSLKNPWLFALPDGRFGVAGIRIEGDGGEDGESRGCAVFFLSGDLMEYEEIGLLKLGGEYIERISCVYDQESSSFRIQWQEQTGDCFTASLQSVEDLRLVSAPKSLDKSDLNGLELPTDTGIEGAVPHNVLEVSKETVARLCRKLLPLVNTGVSFPEQVMASSPEELGQYLARAEYSDGSHALKTVDWDLSGVDFSVKGVYEIAGKIHQDHYAFPVALNRADPCIGRWKGKYYFIATNDADNNHTLYIREADSIPELVDAREHLILDSNTYPGIGGLLWAPEFHEIDGRLYI
ncbi:MAG: glycosyl hydrolase, partial [Acetatifactor sp.]|nr:glycosyl hydrolase [Acetatifactor sp.]